MGNQTGRTIGGTAYTQTFDYDNRLLGVAGGAVSATFLYDAAGNRVKGTVAGVTNVYIAGLYEWQNGAVTKYYEGGAIRRTGYATDNGVFYVVSDHLRSTSVLVNQNGTVKSRNYYYPYGGNRGSAFSGITTKRFTGQYHEQGLPGGEGLSYYNARWYDSRVSVFISADTLVPSPLAPQTFNRYAYARGNPTRYNDPTGHDVGCPGRDASECGGGGSSSGSGGGGGGSTTGGGGAVYTKPAPKPFSLPDPYAGPEYSLWRWVGGCTQCHAAKDFGHVPTNAELVPYLEEMQAKAKWVLEITPTILIGAALLVETGQSIQLMRAMKAPPAPTPLAVIQEGEFSIIDWSGYPGQQRPAGPFRILTGQEYKAQRAIATATNNALHASDPALNGLHIHEIHPVKFGGDPVAMSNKIFLTPADHYQYTAWWNHVQRIIEGH